MAHRCLLDRSELRESGLRGDKEDISVSVSRAKVSQRREEKRMMQADENDAKAQALWVILS